MHILLFYYVHTRLLEYISIIIGLQDFKAIGIKKKGFQLKLEKEVKKLPAPQFQMKDIPVS